MKQKQLPPAAAVVVTAVIFVTALAVDTDIYFGGVNVVAPTRASVIMISLTFWNCTIWYHN